MFTEKCCPDWLPKRVNTGAWLSHYTVDELDILVPQQQIVLPICSFATPPEQVERLGPLVLPPLFTEALNDDLKSAILSRINACFPYLEGSQRRGQVSTKIDIIELSPP